ncbi:DNA-binding response regulator [Aureimonas glaciei]|uniref:DNA-binding response regulator n=2 Tax=Aureimonas glaciei TaxID=1776957 RepID=A0A916Y7Y5_9HYPH|nr:DNA-binding response regulator [Aureimonas glaciei]
MELIGIILIIDGHHLRRDCLTALVAPWANGLNLKVIAISSDDVGQVEDYAEKAKLIVLNVGSASLHDPQMSRLVDTLRIKCPEVPCAIVSDRADPAEALIACRLGRKAFVSSDLDPALVLKAFSFLMNGGTYFPLEALLAGSQGERGLENARLFEHDGTREALTKRQAEVLDGLRRGKSNKVIARELQMQESTVKVHVRQIMRKMGASNRTQAALLAQAKYNADEPTHALNGIDQMESLMLPKVTASMINRLPAA